MMWSTAAMPRSPRIARQVADVSLNDLEVRQLAESLLEQPGEIRVALDHHDPAPRARALGDRLSDRPGAATQLDECGALAQSIL